MITDMDKKAEYATKKDIVKGKSEESGIFQRVGQW